jgi:hypothetical protein
MAKDIVFVLHGIGQYGPGWIDQESCAVPVLRQVAQQYPFFEGKTIDSFVEFVPILYDDVFQRIMEHWKKLADGLTESIPVVPGFLDRTLQLMKGATKSDWAHTHGADVALYWGFRLFQQRVVLHVLAQMTRKIADTIGQPDGQPQYHVLAHSLGTAVAHDALHHLGTEAWLAQLQDTEFDDDDADAASAERDTYVDAVTRLRQRVPNPLNPERFKFESITMISNVSALIHPSTSPYHSIVRPGSSHDMGAYAQNYFNVNHKFDPVSIVGDFVMPAGWKMMGGFDTQVDHVFKDPQNIHDAAHYVRNPRVHVPLLAFYVNAYAPTPDDVAQRDVFEKACKKALTDQVEKKLVQFAAGKIGDFGKLLDLIAAFKKAEAAVSS